MAQIQISQLPTQTTNGEIEIPATDPNLLTTPTGNTGKYFLSDIFNFLLASMSLTTYAAVACATTANLTATYNNGTAGVGATLTNSGTQSAFGVDSFFPALNSRVLVKNQSTQAQNGIYVLTTVGSASTNWVLTRSTDFNSPSNVKQYGVVLVDFGAINGGFLYQETGAGPFTIGTTAIVFSLFTFNSLNLPVLLSQGGTSASLTASNGGIFYSTASAGAILPGTATSNQMLQSGISSAPSWSTSTWPATTTVNQILYSSSASVVSGLVTANSAQIVTNSSGVPAWSSSMTNGQLIIGSTGATPSPGTLTASTGITITNGAASITIASNGANPWVDQTTSSVTMTSNTGYTSDAGASLVTYTVPTTSAIGDWVEINGKGSGLWTIAQASGQQIKISNTATTSGAGGSLSSVNANDCVRLRCITANTIWDVVSQQSTGLTVV